MLEKLVIFIVTGREKDEKADRPFFFFLLHMPTEVQVKETRTKCPSKVAPSQKYTDAVVNLTGPLGPETRVQSCIH